MSGIPTRSPAVFQRLCAPAGIRLLVVEDDPVMAEALCTVLGEAGYEVTAAATGVECLLKLTGGERFDLVLLDVELPELDGWSVLLRLRADPSTARLPVIMLTALSGEYDEIDLLIAGADDYLAKPFSFDSLVARINALLRRSELQSFNPLTGLPGNREVERFLRECASEQDRFWAAAYVDIDNFKAYNDARGFLRGDEVLKWTADLLANAVRSSPHRGFVGNIGGDDFLLGIMTGLRRTDPAGPADANSMLSKAAAEFDRSVSRFYAASELARGYIESESRRGGIERYPIVSLSIAVVTNSRRLFKRPVEISNALASVKTKAKSIPGSAICFDQRKR